MEQLSPRVLQLTREYISQGYGYSLAVEYAKKEERTEREDVKMVLRTTPLKIATFLLHQDKKFSILLLKSTSLSPVTLATLDITMSCVS